ncbi:MAG: aminotransferase class I/II-fold pyridoxal phosphate-dependent enzyme [Acidobacteria bacterium]|nr:aminotransferase class I/II-fold pyridoxal phosphate-dependent enzyme [Acidobacteriota bacterium]
MRIRPFRLERFFAGHEFTARHLLSPSDCETLSLRELLGLASPESMELWDGLRFGYTESQGHPLLRSEVAKLYASIRPDDVLIAVPEEAIFLLMHALLDPGDHVAVVSPAYQSLHEVARSIGCEVTACPVQAEPPGWRFDLDLLRRSLSGRTRLLVVNFPHNPTGCLPAREEFDALVDIARQWGLHLFSDEMYRFLEYDEESRLPAACDIYEKAISLSGLSKSFGLPGLRTGWLATRDARLLGRCQTIKDYTTICHSAPGEVLSIIALRARSRIAGRNLGIVRRNLTAARAFFANHGGLFRWMEPRGGPVAFPLWTGPVPLEEFCRRILEERSVLIVPGSLFEFPGSHFRLGLGRLSLGEALTEVADFCEVSLA